MRKMFFVLFLTLFIILLFSSCGCKHEWSEATCKSAAFCKLCGESKGEPNSESHNIVVINGKEASCTQTGLTNGKYCSNCAKVFEEQKDIPMTDHTVKSVGEVAPTCLAIGKTAGKKCSVCNTVIEGFDDIPKLEHKAVSSKKIEATCTSTGLTAGKYCEICNTTIEGRTLIAKVAHKEVKDKAVEATCEKSGKTEGSHCSVCKGVIIAQQTISKKSHKFDNGKCVWCDLLSGKIKWEIKNFNDEFGNPSNEKHLLFLEEDNYGTWNCNYDFLNDESIIIPAISVRKNGIIILLFSDVLDGNATGTAIFDSTFKMTVLDSSGEKHTINAQGVGGNEGIVIKKDLKKLLSILNKGGIVKFHMDEIPYCYYGDDFNFSVDADGFKYMYDKL